VDVFGRGEKRTRRVGSSLARRQVDVLFDK